MMRCASCSISTIRITRSAVSCLRARSNVRKLTAHIASPALIALRHAVEIPQRPFAVTHFVSILDVVVDERVIVQDFDGCRGVKTMFERRSESETGAHNDLGTQAFAAASRSVRSVTEVIQKHIGDRARSPIGRYSFFEVGFEPVRRVDG